MWSRCRLHVAAVPYFLIGLVKGCTKTNHLRLAARSVFQVCAAHLDCLSDVLAQERSRMKVDRQAASRVCLVLKKACRIHADDVFQARTRARLDSKHVSPVNQVQDESVLFGAIADGEKGKFQPQAGQDNCKTCQRGYTRTKSHQDCQGIIHSSVWQPFNCA